MRRNDAVKLVAAAPFLVDDNSSVTTLATGVSRAPTLESVPGSLPGDSIPGGSGSGAGSCAGSRGSGVAGSGVAGGGVGDSGALVSPTPLRPGDSLSGGSLALTPASPQGSVASLAAASAFMSVGSGFGGASGFGSASGGGGGSVGGGGGGGGGASVGSGGTTLSAGQEAVEALVASFKASVGKRTTARDFFMRGRGTIRHGFKGSGWWNEPDGGASVGFEDPDAPRAGTGVAGLDGSLVSGVTSIGASGFGSGDSVGSEGDLSAVDRDAVDAAAAAEAVQAELAEARLLVKQANAKRGWAALRLSVKLNATDPSPAALARITEGKLACAAAAAEAAKRMKAIEARLAPRKEVAVGPSDMATLRSTGTAPLLRVEGRPARSAPKKLPPGQAALEKKRLEKRAKLQAKRKAMGLPPLPDDKGNADDLVSLGSGASSAMPVRFCRNCACPDTSQVRLGPLGRLKAAAAIDPLRFPRNVVDVPARREMAKGIWLGQPYNKDAFKPTDDEK